MSDTHGAYETGRGKPTGREKPVAEGGSPGDAGLSRLGDLLDETGLAPERLRDSPATSGAGKGASTRQRPSSALPMGSAGTPPGPTDGLPADEREDIARRVAGSWAEIVGEDAADNSCPIQLNRGRLVVSTSSSAWAQSLQFMGEAIRERLNASLVGEHTGGSREEPVKTIFFRHAGWERSTPGPGARSRGADARPTPGSTPAPPESEVAAKPASSAVGPPQSRPARSRLPEPGLTGEQQDALAKLDDLDVPAELRDAMRRAMRTAFVREERG